MFQVSQSSIVKFRPTEARGRKSEDYCSLTARRQSRVKIQIPSVDIIDSLCNSLKTGNAYEREPKDHAIIRGVLGNPDFKKYFV